MGGKRGVWLVVVLAVALLATAGFVYAAEHPAEHPSGTMQMEHPAKQMGGMQQAELTKQDLADAIRTYVDKDSDLKGGYFLIYDRQEEEPLVLTLKDVHEDRLATIGNGTYFACADFVTPDGKLYDLDIFMKGTNKDNMEVTDITIHKAGGKERYTWFEDKGVWKMKPLPGPEGTMPKQMKGMEGTMHKGMEGSGSK